MPLPLSAIPFILALMRFPSHRKAPPRRAAAVLITKKTQEQRYARMFRYRVCTTVVKDYIQRKVLVGRLKVKGCPCVSATNHEGGLVQALRHGTHLRGTQFTNFNEMEGNVVRIGETNCYKIMAPHLICKERLGELRKWEYNIKMCRTELVCQGMNLVKWLRIGSDSKLM